MLFGKCTNDRSLEIVGDQESVNFLCKEPGSKYFRLCRPDVFITTPQLHCCSVKAALDSMKTNGYRYVPINFTYKKF